MSLVNYGSSGESEEEVDTHLDSETKLINTKEESSPIKKIRETKKITIPSLQEFKDEDDEVKSTTKLKPKGGSGLFALLPPPKYSTQSFTPHILTKQKDSKQPNKRRPDVRNTSKASSQSAFKVQPLKSFDEIEEDEEENANSALKNNFFSIDDAKDIPSKSIVAEETGVSVRSSSSSNCDSPQLSSESLIENNFEESQLQLSNQYIKAYESSNDLLFSQPNPAEDADSNDALPSFEEDKEFIKLKGKLGNVEFVDVNAEDQMTNREEWVMRSLTEETQSTSSNKRKRHDFPTSQQKRKHQITYLAFQAKERELDLKNQWALNSSTRRETQAKYGF